MLKGKFTVFTFSTLLFHERSKILFLKVFFSIVVQSLSRVWLFTTPRTAVCQDSLSFTISWSLLKLMSIESVMSSNHLILCCPLFLLPSIFPSIWVFSNESALHTRLPKYWNLNFSISPSTEYSGLISFRVDWLDLLVSKGLLRIFSLLWYIKMVTKTKISVMVIFVVERIWLLSECFQNVLNNMQTLFSYFTHSSLCFLLWNNTNNLLFADPILFPILLKVPWYC